MRDMHPCASSHVPRSTGRTFTAGYGKCYGYLISGSYSAYTGPHINYVCDYLMPKTFPIISPCVCIDVVAAAEAASIDLDEYPIIPHFRKRNIVHSYPC